MAEISERWPEPIAAVAQFIVNGALEGAGSYLDVDVVSVDYEPALEPWNRETFVDWLEHWTGSSRAPVDLLVPIGEDGSGGQVVLVLPDAGSSWLDAPVALLGSEGDVTVLGRDFADFSVLLSLGFGPTELLEHLDPDHPVEAIPAPSHALQRFVTDRYSDRLGRSPARIVADAEAALPGFEAIVDTWIE